MKGGPYKDQAADVLVIFWPRQVAPPVWSFKVKSNNESSPTLGLEQGCSYLLKCLSSQTLVNELSSAADLRHTEIEDVLQPQASNGSKILCSLTGGV